jgi:hypothetical protein
MRANKYSSSTSFISLGSRWVSETDDVKQGRQWRHRLWLRRHGSKISAEKELSSSRATSGQGLKQEISSSGGFPGKGCVSEYYCSWLGWAEHQIPSHSRAAQYTSGWGHLNVLLEVVLARVIGILLQYCVWSNYCARMNLLYTIPYVHSITIPLSRAMYVVRK